MPRSGLPARNVARVEQIYADYKAGNLEVLLSALTPDAVWLSVGSTPFPWAGERIGRLAVEAYFKALSQEFAVTRYELERIIAEDDWVVILADIRLKFQESGVEHDLRKADFMRLRDGMIAEFREYYDTQGLAAQRTARV